MTKDWQCQECGHRMTLAQAEKAAFGDRGCPSCGSSDIDEATDKEGPHGPTTS